MGADKIIAEGLSEVATSPATNRLFETVVGELAGAAKAGGGLARSLEHSSALNAGSKSDAEPMGWLMQAAQESPHFPAPERITGIDHAVKGAVTSEPIGLDDQSLASAGILRTAVERSAEGNLMPGVYKSDWQQFVQENGFNEHRLGQLRNVEPLMRELQSKGLNEVYVGGSFATKKVTPGDLDFTAILNDNHSTKLWERVDYLRDHPKGFSEHMMLGFEARGLSDTSVHTLRFNRAQQEVGIVKLKLPTAKDALFNLSGK